MVLQLQMEGHAVAVLMIFCILFCNAGNMCSAANYDSVVNIGVILNYNSWVGKVAKTAIEIARDDINRDTQLLNGSRLVLHFRDSLGDAIQGALAVLDLLEMEVVAIIGPQASDVAEFILHLGDTAQVPVVSFSVTSPLLSNRRFPYFVRMAHSDALQMHPIAALAQAYGWKRVTAVYSDDEFRSGAVASLSDALRDIGSEIEYRSVISLTADQVAIEGELYKLMTKESRVFVAYMPSDLCSKILMKAQEIGMMDSGYVWITADEFTSLWDVLLNASSMDYMQGLLGVKTYIQNSKKFADFRGRWKRQFRLEYPHEEKAELNVYGSFAYDAVWMIARAIENLGNTSFNFIKPISSSTSFPQLNVLQEGPQLLTELGKTDFSGVSGVVQLKDGEIVGSTYEIANVVGNGYRVVGYWNDETQLSKQLPSGASSPSNPNNTIGDLKTVIWPGGSTEVPRGWEQPTSGKRLKIGVPVKHGFTEFVTVTFDSSRNRSNVTGFCIDVFDAVVNRLDYALPYDLIPYGNNNHTHYYDDLVDQVHLEVASLARRIIIFLPLLITKTSTSADTDFDFAWQKFDAVVGDTTIFASRSKHVDFTQPFTESGVVMVVPIKADEANNAWAFMLPFTPGMWCTTAAFFIFTGFVIWLFEHRVNPEFRGRPRQQVVTLLWFSFSTLVFSHREKLVSSLSRLVLVIWLFVVLILTSSYTASLTSILTVQKLNPTVKDFESLKASGDAVGYQTGSFVAQYLQLELGIKNLKTYSTPEEAGLALSKGPKNGGVAAIFDEIPYIRIFLASQCNYTIVGPIYRTGGFGFVFPKGSPLLPDISRAVLSLSEDKEMQQIQAKWLNSTACTDSGAKVDSNRLSMESFWGLYLITGSASVIALVIFLSMLLYEYMRDPNVMDNDNCKMDDPSTGKSLKRAMKSFMVYIDQKEGSTSSPNRRVSEMSPSQRNSPFSPPALTSSPSALGTSPFSTRTLSRRSFSVLDHEHVVDVGENAIART
eukprot:PITA_33031